MFSLIWFFVFNLCFFITVCNANWPSNELQNDRNPSFLHQFASTRYVALHSLNLWAELKGNFLSTKVVSLTYKIKNIVLNQGSQRSQNVHESVHGSQLWSYWEIEVCSSNVVCYIILDYILKYLKIIWWWVWSWRTAPRLHFLQDKLLCQAWYQGPQCLCWYGFFLEFFYTSVNMTCMLHSKPHDACQCSDVRVCSSHHLWSWTKRFPLHQIQEVSRQEACHKTEMVWVERHQNQNF